MPYYIIMTSGQADHVRDAIAPSWVPIKRADGNTYILPAGNDTNSDGKGDQAIFLDAGLDPDILTYLGALPQMEPTDPGFPPPWSPPEDE